MLKYDSVASRPNGRAIALRKVLIAQQSVILILAVVVLGVSGHSLATSTNASTVRIRGVSTSYGGQTYLFPADLNTGPTWALTATGIGGTIDAILCLLILFFAYPNPPQRFLRKKLSIPLFIVLFVSVVRSLTAVAYGWSQDQSPVLDLATLTQRRKDWSGWTEFTIFGWSSQMMHLVTDEGARGLFMQLRREVWTVRVLALIIAILDVVALGVGTRLWSLTRKER